MEGRRWRVQGVGPRVVGFWFGLSALGFGVWGLGFGVWVWGLGEGVLDGLRGYGQWFLAVAVRCVL
jgi:hypothetical protein